MPTHRFQAAALHPTHRPDRRIRAQSPSQYYQKRLPSVQTSTETQDKADQVALSGSWRDILLSNVSSFLGAIFSPGPIAPAEEDSIERLRHFEEGFRQGFSGDYFDKIDEKNYHIPPKSKG